MKEIKRTERELIIETEEDESIDFVLRNRKTREQKVLRTWFMPTQLKLEALKLWQEIVKEQMTNDLKT